MSHLKSSTPIDHEELSAVPSELIVNTATLTIDEEDGLNTAAVANSAAVESQTEVNINPNRLYISNVSYQTTEDDLKDLLHGYSIVSVLIPSQTVRGLKSFHQKSLGIAYVDFANESDAQLAKNELNGKVVDDRALRVKPFVEYSPRASFIRRSRSSRHTSGGHRHRFGRSSKNVDINDQIEEESSEEPKEQEIVNGEDSSKPKLSEGDAFSEQQALTAPVETCSDKHTSDELTEATDDSNSINKQEVSKDTVYVTRLNPKTTDGDLRDFFHEYIPTDVYIFKNRPNKKQHSPIRFHQRLVSALVTLTLDDGALNASESLNNKKLKGKAVKVLPAYISKIEDVKKAAAARQKKQEKLDKESSASLSIESCKSTGNSPKLVDETEGKPDSINVVQDTDEGFEDFQNESPVQPVGA